MDDEGSSWLWSMWAGRAELGALARAGRLTWVLAAALAISTAGGCSGEGGAQPDAIPTSAATKYTASAGPVFISAEEVDAQLPELVLLDARDNADQGAIPGAVHAPWTAFVDSGAGSAARSVLVSDAELQARLRSRGVRDGAIVVVYGDWDSAWGEEGRLFWMLHYLGVEVRCLYGA